MTADAPYEIIRHRYGSGRWLAARHQGIGASEIAAVLGISPYDSPRSLFLRKTAALPEKIDTERMEWGRRLEAPILGKYVEEHRAEGPGGKLTLRHIVKALLVRAVDRPWQMATLDGWVPSLNRVVEVKTAANRWEWGEPGTDEVPVHYRAQILQQMDVMGAAEGHLIVLFDGRDYREYVVPYSDKEIRILRIRGSQFWRNVQSGAAPPVDSHPATTDAMRRMTDVEEAVPPALVPVELQFKINRAKAVQKAAEAMRDRLENELRDLMGVAGVAITDNSRVVATRSAFPVRRVDLESLRQEDPEVAERHTRVSTGGRLTVRKNPPKEKSE